MLVIVSVGVDTSILCQSLFVWATFGSVELPTEGKLLPLSISGAGGPLPGLRGVLLLVPCHLLGVIPMDLAVVESQRRLVTANLPSILVTDGGKVTPNPVSRSILRPVPAITIN